MEIGQELLNWLLSLLGIGLGGFMAVLFQTVRDLRVADIKLSESLTQVQILVAGNYVRKDEFARLTDVIIRKLDELSERLHSKEDRRKTDAKI